MTIFSPDDGSVLGLAVHAPLCAVEPVHDERCHVIHAVTMQAILGLVAGVPLVSACLCAEVKLWSVPIGSENVVPWPVSTRGLPKPMTRCRACWEATGRKRPASRLAPLEKGIPDVF